MGVPKARVSRVVFKKVEVGDGKRAEVSEVRGMNHTLIEEEVHSMAYIPPPAVLKSVPYEGKAAFEAELPVAALSNGIVDGAAIEQPTFLP